MTVVKSVGGRGNKRNKNLYDILLLDVISLVADDGGEMIIWGRDSE
jgi:hypothetical protein